MEELNNPKPNNYLLLAIFSTLCCCLPLGICAIIRSIKVNDYYSKKQYDAAEAASADAKKWSIIGIVTGVIFQVIYFGFLGGMSYLSALSH
jgi:Interferon-induced transmembrane protein.